MTSAYASGALVAIAIMAAHATIHDARRMWVGTWAATLVAIGVTLFDAAARHATIEIVAAVIIGACATAALRALLAATARDIADNEHSRHGDRSRTSAPQTATPEPPPNGDHDPMHTRTNTIETHADWIELLWLATQRTPASRPRTEVAWCLIEATPGEGYAARRQRETEALAAANARLDPPRGGTRIVDASALLGAWMAHGGYGDTYAQEPENIDGDIVGRWIIDHLAGELRRGADKPDPAVLTIVCGTDWIDREWGAGRVQHIIDTVAENHTAGPPRLAVLIEHKGASLRGIEPYIAPRG